MRVFCNVHHGMFGYIFVVASPYWARVGADGTFSIPDVPAGAGKLTVWNERSSPTTLDLTLPLAVPPTDRHRDHHAAHSAAQEQTGETLFRRWLWLSDAAGCRSGRASFW